MAEVNMESFIDYVENMTVLELSKLVKALEERLGVSAAAPVAVAAAAPAAAAVVSEAMIEPTKAPFCQLVDWYTRGAVFARRPPNTIADTGTP